MFNVDLKQFKGSHQFEGSNQKIKGVNFPSFFLGFIINENQVYEISIVDHGNVNKKEMNKMVFEQIPDLERKNQGRSIDKIIDCCTKLGIDGSQVENVVSVAIHNKNLHVLVTDMFKINRGISSSIMKGIFEPKAEHPYNLRCISQFSSPLVSTVFHGTESISFFGPKI